MPTPPTFARQGLPPILPQPSRGRAQEPLRGFPYTPPPPQLPRRQPDTPRSANYPGQYVHGSIVSPSPSLAHATPQRQSPSSRSHQPSPVVASLQTPSPQHF